MSSYIYLNTRDGSGNNYETQWSIFSSRLANLRGYSVSLVNVTFPNTVYPINEFNNIVTYTQNSVQRSFTVPVGSYTLSTMVSALNTGFGVYATVTAAAAPLDKNITITPVTNAITLDDVENNIFTEIGFATSAVIPVAGSTGLPVSLQGTNYVDLVTNFSSNNYSTSNSQKILVRIPIQQEYGTIVFHEPTTPHEVFVGQSQFDDIYMGLYDDKGNKFKLNANSYLSMTLSVTNITNKS
tara:strand:- start:1877 stop:2596 length:720 start_codon:yes stop_codon:yes gene_type:complete